MAGSAPSTRGSLGAAADVRKQRLRSSALRWQALLDDGRLCSMMAGSSSQDQVFPYARLTSRSDVKGVFPASLDRCR